jgi:hypothetical protein
MAVTVKEEGTHVFPSGGLKVAAEPGGGIFTLFAYLGSPATHVAANEKGDICVDVTNAVLYIASAAGTGGWGLAVSNTVSKANVDAALGTAAITGALSTVADAAAKAVLTSIIACLVSAGIAINGTT